MENLTSYIIYNTVDEVLSIFKNSLEKGNSILWQTYENHRKIFDVTIVKFDPVKKEIILNYQSSTDFLNQEKFVYIKLAYRDSVFKGEITSLTSQQVSVKFPQEIHSKDFREEVRHSLTPERFYAILKNKSHASTYKIELKDISYKGIGFYVRDRDSQAFKKGEHVLITTLGKGLLSTPLYGVVIYSKKASREDFTQVGIKMMDYIPSQIIDDYTNKAFTAEDFMKAMTDTNILSQEFQEKINKHVSKTVAKLKKRPALANHLALLDMNRGDDNYLNNHIQVLHVLCTYISRSLNWISDASIEKFVYASYVHDAPFFRSPKLAKISSVEEYEQKSNVLTDVEKYIFETHPLEATKIVRSDQSAPVDVETIILQQRERPDGKGYPNQLGPTKISPMSAVFIVSHDLAHEITTNPNWNLEKWINKNKNFYKGGYFTKVFESLKTLSKMIKVEK